MKTPMDRSRDILTRDKDQAKYAYALAVVLTVSIGVILFMLRGSVTTPIVLLILLNGIFGVGSAVFVGLTKSRQERRLSDSLSESEDFDQLAESLLNEIASGGSTAPSKGPVSRDSATESTPFVEKFKQASKKKGKAPNQE